MAAALGFALNLAGVFVPVGFEVSKSIVDGRGKTVIQIMTGDHDNTKAGEDGDWKPLSDAGGLSPHIALWNQQGARLGQYHPASWDNTPQGNDPSTTGQIVITHTQNGGRYEDPGYIMLSKLDDDAICIASVQVSNGAISSTFYGDTGFTCGQSWYYSARKFGPALIAPKCVWLDADHTSGINARAMSWHINDMIPAHDKIAMYQQNIDVLCKSTPRFSVWGNMLPDGIPPFFDPPLEYNIDSVSGGEGADVDPGRAIDKRVYDKSVYLRRDEPKQDRRSNRPPSRPRVSKRQGTNPDPSHLVITEMDGQSARELCEHSNSFGHDLVSIKDGLYCDMVSKQLYSLCDEENVAGNCFHLSKRTLIGHGGISARGEASTDGVPQKRYNTHSHWK